MSFMSSHWAIVRHALDEEKRHVTGLIRTKETAFLPAALEITERPVSPTARATTWILLIGLVLTMGWLTFGRVDVVASAQGKLIPADNVKLVQPAESGIVRAILVRDGQTVKKGQALIELDPTVSGAEAEQARSALQTAELDAARARAVLSGLDGKGLVFIVPPGTPDDVARTQQQLARAELAGVEAMIAGNAADSRVASAARGEAQVQAAKLGETLPLLDQQIAANEALLEKGYVSKLRVIEMKRQRLIAGRDRDAALQMINRANAQMWSAGSGSARNRAEARAKVLGDLAKAVSDASLRREELVKSTQRSSLQRLLSPVDGIIAQLAVHTIGGVVEAAKPIMVVVPSGDSLVVEAKVLNKDMGFVSVGQAVAVKLEAFPFTRFGTVPGVITSIGSDAVENEKLGLVYTVRVKLSRATMARGDTTVALTPGMAATADIKTGRRSILSYLVSPIDEARLNAGHER
jgi:hemolysin D